MRVLDEQELKRTMANLLGVDESEVTKVTAMTYQVETAVTHGNSTRHETRMVQVG